MRQVLKRLTSQDDKEVILWFHCPGCKRGHGYRTRAHPNQPDAPVWEWNGDTTAPTFTPSLLVDGDETHKRCHLYCRDGRLEFLSDCHHELAGTTVDMHPVDDD